MAALPTFQIFKNGSKVDEVVGADIRALTALLEKHNAACSVFSGKGRTLAGAPGPSYLPMLRSCGGWAAAGPALSQRDADLLQLLIPYLLGKLVFKLSSASPSTDAGESAAAPPPAAPAAAAPSGAWEGPAEGPTVGVQVPAGLLQYQQFVCPPCFHC